jgi:hypothetical protein
LANSGSGICGARRLLSRKMLEDSLDDVRSRDVVSNAQPSAAVRAHRQIDCGSSQRELHADCYVISRHRRGRCVMVVATSSTRHLHPCVTRPAPSSGPAASPVAGSDVNPAAGLQAAKVSIDGAIRNE